MPARWVWRFGMTVVPGTIISGIGAARYTVQLQMPRFVRACPEFAKCYAGTINVRLVRKLRAEPGLFDFLVGPFDWTGAGGVGEQFGFARIGFEVGDSTVAAWLYVPFGSPHRADPYYAEVLAPWIDLGGQSKCNLHFDSAEQLVV